MSDRLILHVAVPAPLFGTFDYLPPREVDPALLQPGVRLLVPFGRGKRCGVLLQADTRTELADARLKRAGPPLDDAPLLQTGDLELLRWAARYYQHPLGEVIAGALPVRLRKGKPPVHDRPEGYRLTEEGRNALAAANPRAPRQQAVLQALAPCPDGLGRTQIYAAVGECAAILRTLAGKGWIVPCHPSPAAPADPGGDAPPPLYPEQQAAVDRVLAVGPAYGAFLLDGVTGSGKTEVYLTLARRMLEQGRQVLVLVPEIGLTPQLMRRFLRRLGGQVALLHSGLNEGQRERAWMAARNGEARVVLGTRSAVFTPLPELGLIIVDEEHDLSFKQQEGFRYSARDLAVMRARLSECPVLLGSATPSLESLHNVDAGRYHRLHLARRAGAAGMPRLQLVDLRAAPLRGGLAPPLIRKVEETLEAGEQVMLFLNRRGYAPVVICHACGWTSRCPRCDANMTLHLGSQLLWCHHCGHQRRLPPACPECGGADLRPLGQGTERLEGLLGDLFPRAPIARIDRDTTRRKGALGQLLDGVRNQRYRLLLGTQMLAKGHHFPNVTLVGILDVDQGLFSADYRAAERMAQLITQVAGRAGRAQKAGQVLIQTHHPEHPLLQTLIHEGYHAFAEQALGERRETRLPPYSHQALLRAEAVQPELAERFLEAASAAARPLVPAQTVEILGPVPAPMARRAGHHRAHLLLQATERASLHALLTPWIQCLAGLDAARRVRWSIDVDPQEMY